MKQHAVQKILRMEGISKKSKMIFITPYGTVLAELETSFITTENTIYVECQYVYFSSQ